jgi:Protein of unknown function (DUF2844)
MKIIFRILLALFLAAPSWAVLGQPAQSVASDQQRMRGQLSSVARQGYTVQQISAPDGMVVKEYLAPSGMVFGISWRGPTMPDLQNLLGSYFPEFQRSAASAGPRHRALEVRTDQLVVESSGHMRSFQGRAYVPSLLPSNVAEDLVE